MEELRTEIMDSAPFALHVHPYSITTLTDFRQRNRANFPIAIITPADYKDFDILIGIIKTKAVTVVVGVKPIKLKLIRCFEADMAVVAKEAKQLFLL